MDELFNEQQLQELAKMGRNASDSDSATLVRYFTGLASHVDNELFSEMYDFGLTSAIMSVTARSSYDAELRSKVERRRGDLRHPSYSDMVEHARDVTTKMIGEIHSMAKQYSKSQGKQYVTVIIPKVSALVDDLLTAAEVVGSGNYMKVA